MTSKILTVHVNWNGNSMGFLKSACNSPLKSILLDPSIGVVVLPKEHLPSDM